MMKYIFVLTFSILCINAVFAQTPAPQQVRYYASGGFSANAYRGDLSPKYAKWSSMFHLALHNNRRRWIGSQFEIGYGTLTGNNLTYTHPQGTPNRFFSTRMLTVNAGLRLNIIKTPDLIVYLSQGIGLTRFTPYDKYNKKLSDLATTRAGGEFYSNTALILPSNLGLVYLFYNGYGIGFETGFLNPQTDYLDNISQLGSDEGKDNALRFRFSLYVPVAFEKPAEKKEEAK